MHIRCRPCGWKWRSASWLAIGGAIALLGDCALAKITPDSTLETESAVVAPSVVIHGLRSNQIEHSFRAGSRLGTLSKLSFTDSLTLENGLYSQSLIAGLFSPGSYSLRLKSLHCHATASGIGIDQVYLHINHNAVGIPYIMKAGDIVNFNPATEISFKNKVPVELFYQDADKLESLGLRRVSVIPLEALQFNNHLIANYTLNYEVVLPIIGIL